MVLAKVTLGAHTPHTLLLPVRLLDNKQSLPYAGRVVKAAGVSRPGQRHKAVAVRRLTDTAVPGGLRPHRARDPEAQHRARNKRGKSEANQRAPKLQCLRVTGLIRRARKMLTSRRRCAPL